MVRAGAAREGHEDAVHVLAVLRRPARREPSPPATDLCVRVYLTSKIQCLGQEFALNQAGFFIVRLLQRFQSFALAPDFMPAGALPPAHWAGMPGRQGVEKIHPAINFTLHSKVRLRGLLFFVVFAQTGIGIGAFCS